MVGAGSLVVGAGSLGVVGAGSLGVVGAGSLVVVVGFLGVVGVGDLVIVSALGVDVAGTSGVGARPLVDVFSAVRVSLAEVVLSFALVEVCLFVVEVSLVSTVVSLLTVEGISLVVSELGGRLGLGSVGFTVVALGVVVTLLRCVVGMLGVGVSLKSLSGPLPSSSITGGSGVGLFLGVLFFLSFTREKKIPFYFCDIKMPSLSLTGCVCLGKLLISNMSIDLL